jgi:ubiquinone/menaquinone biosynthesis C-methylase UbiE
MNQRMFNRRTLLSASAVTLAGAAVGAEAAESPKPTPSKSGQDLQPRNQVGRLERLPRLDLESRHDYLTGFRIWVNSDMAKAAGTRAASIMKQNKHEPDAPLPIEKVVALLEKDPLVSLHPMAWLGVQQVMWKSLQREFHSKADQYLAEMEAFDKRGPGTLELNPAMPIPEYAAHEIHMQPGGYVGDPFAGHIYHYGTNEFYNGRNYQDETHRAVAADVPLPKDGKVKRILDIGCSCGQLTVALKERFPEAEVWGIDVGGPMVRYAHMRAVDLGVEVHFAQRLAEDSKFPENHFDIVTSNILHHEVTAEATKQIFKEVHRVLRPGGHYYPSDFYTAQPPSKQAYERFRRFWIHRWNHEDWYREYASVDFPAEMKRVGFVVAKNMESERKFGNVIAIKQA